MATNDNKLVTLGNLKEFKKQLDNNTMPLDEVDRICAEAWGVSEEEFK